MSTENKNVIFEQQSADSVPVTETQLCRNTENNTKLPVIAGKKYNEILKQSFSVRKTMKGTKYTERTDEIKKLIVSMKSLYIYTIYSNNLDDKIKLAHAYLNMSHIYIDGNEIEALPFCQDCLIKCTILLKDDELNSKVILLALKIYNELGKTWILAEKPEISKFYFQEALEFYLSYTVKKDDYPAPINIITIDYENEEDSKAILEELYILTLENLVKVYNANVGFDQFSNHKAALYMRMLLRIKSSKVPSTIGHFEWALQAATLSEYFAMFNYFKDAKSYLTAASSMMLKVYKTYVNIDEEHFPFEKAQMYDKYQSGVANIAISWARYGIALLRSSSEKLILNGKKEEPPEENSLISLNTIPTEDQLIELLFSDKTKDIKKLQPQITDDYIKKHDDVVITFKIIIKWLEKAEEYYTPSKCKLMYVSIIQDISKAYKYLAIFEIDKYYCITLQEKRIIILNTALSILNIIHDKAICKQLWNELATIYFILIDIEIENSRYYTPESFKTETFPRISMLLQYARNYLQLFLQ